MRVRTLAAVLPALLAFALAACGSDQPGAEVASAGGADTGSAPSSAPSLDPGEMAVKFAQCLRENGLDVDDPMPGEGLRLRFDGSVPREKVDAAMEACREYSPQQVNGGQPDPEAEERGRAFATCMRDNGVEAFPDPEPGQRGIRINAEVGEDPDFKAAQEKCQEILGGLQGGPGGRVTSGAGGR